MSCPNCLPTAHRLVPQIPSPISVGVRIPSPQVWECSGTSCPFCGWGLSPQVSPRAPHLETNITPFATQTSKKEEDEGQQTGAGNEDYSVGRSQRGSAQSESICGHKAGLGSGIPDTDYRTLYPSHPGPVLDYNSHDAQHPETPLAERPGGLMCCGSCSLRPSQLVGGGVPLFLPSWDSSQPLAPNASPNPYLDSFQ